MKLTVWRRVLVCGLLLTSMVACKRGSRLAIDDPVPVAVLRSVQGQTVHLPMDMKGKVWLVRFWSLDCGFCDKDTLPGLEALYQKYKDRGFVPVAVNVGEYDSKDPRWQRFAALTYPMLVDERGIFAKKFGVIGMPTTFVIDRDGLLREKVVGEAGLLEFERLFTAVLNKE